MWIKLKLPFQLSNIQRKIMLYAVLFCYFFGLNMFHMNTRKGAIVVAMVYLLAHSDELRNVLKHIKTHYMNIYFILGLFWSAGLIYRDIFIPKNSLSNYMSPLALFYLFIQVFVMAFFVLACCRSVGEFGKIVVNLMIFQSFVSFSSIFLPIVKRVLLWYYSFTTWIKVPDYLASSTVGVGIGLISSNGTEIMLTSQILLVYLKLRGLVSKRRFIISYMTISFGEVFIGRTGFYLSIVFLLCYFLSEKRVLSKYTIMLKFLLLSIGGIAAFFILVRIMYPDIYTLWIDRVFEGVQGLMADSVTEGSITVLRFSEMTYPKLTWETLWGTNITGGISYAGTVFHNDIGYMQTYFGMGMIGATLYYLAHLILFLHPVLTGRVKHKKFFFFATMILFICELKDPAMHQSTISFMLLSIEMFEMLRVAGYKPETESVQVRKRG